MAQLTKVQIVEPLDGQVATPKIWARVSPKANIGDRICVPFTPIMEVVDKDTCPNGQTWLLVKPNSGSYTEKWLLDVEEDVQQLAKLQLPSQEDFEQSKQNGQQDTATRSHPICAKDECNYSTQYLESCKGLFASIIPKTGPASPSWLVTYDSNRQLYRVWVGDACGDRGSDYRAIGAASTSEEAERIGQKYIATEQL